MTKKTPSLLPRSRTQIYFFGFWSGITLAHSTLLWNRWADSILVCMHGNSPDFSCWCFWGKRKLGNLAFSLPRAVSRSFPCCPCSCCCVFLLLAHVKRYGEENHTIKGKRERINLFLLTVSWRSHIVCYVCVWPPKTYALSHTHTHTLMWHSRCQEKGRVVRWGGGRGGRGWGY